MNGGQYLLSGEFVAVVLFLFGPPLLLAFAAQLAAYVSRRAIVKLGVVRLAGSFLVTALGSLLLALAIHQFAPRSLGQVLRVRDVSLGGSVWPVMPLAILSVAAAAVIVAALVLRARGQAPSTTW